MKSIIAPFARLNYRGVPKTRQQSGGVKMPSAEQKLIPIGKRKLMPMGDGGLVVTVPRIWIRFHQLKVGDKVELGIDNDGELRVRATKLLAPVEDTSDEG